MLGLMGKSSLRIVMGSMCPNGREPKDAICWKQFDQIDLFPWAHWFGTTQQVIFQPASISNKNYTYQGNRNNEDENEANKHELKWGYPFYGW